MTYYTGGYYLIELEKANFGNIQNRVIFTCSTCINNSYLDSWSLSWTEDGKNPKESRIPLHVIPTLHKKIQSWSDIHFENKEIGWVNVFSTLKSAQEYYNLFFKNNHNLKILAIFFPETEAEEVIKYFVPKSQAEGKVGLYQNLLNRIVEDESGDVIGYDFIGVEHDGGFHTFHCHDLENELKHRFNVKVNSNGLLDFPQNWSDIIEYFNDENNGFESTPWFFVKVKQYELK